MVNDIRERFKKVIAQTLEIQQENGSSITFR